MTSKYFYHKFFEVEDITINGKTYYLDNYLHGNCDIFIIKLFEFGKKNNIQYPICVIADKEGITHAFSWVNSPEEGLDYFIDVRGITSDKYEFFEEFDNFFDYQSWFNGNYEPEDGEIYWFYSIKDYLDFMKKKFPEDDWYFEQNNLLSESEEILNNFKEFYLLPQWIIEEINE